MKYNEHSGNCRFYKDFKSKFYLSEIELEKIKLDSFHYGDPFEKTFKVCCCSPELPHDETFKFLIVKRNYELE